MINAGIYVFGITTADHPCEVADLTGVGAQGAVRRVAAEHTAAVVCTAPAHLRAKRRDLLAHQRVVESVWQQGPVLPMRFGVVAPSEEQLRAELIRSSARHSRALKEVDGRGEMNVKAIQDEALLVQQAAADPTVRRLIPARTYASRLQLGSAVAAAARQRATADELAILRALGPFAVRVADGPPVEDCAMNTCFLVDLNRVEEFLDRANAFHSTQYRLRVTGPLPPYSFTE